MRHAGCLYALRHVNAHLQHFKERPGCGREQRGERRLQDECCHHLQHATQLGGRLLVGGAVAADRRAGEMHPLDECVGFAGAGHLRPCHARCGGIEERHPANEQGIFGEEVANLFDRLVEQVALLVAERVADPPVMPP